MSLPVCQLSLPPLANSVFHLNYCGLLTYGKKKIEFASLPRFLIRTTKLTARFRLPISKKIANLFFAAPSILNGNVLIRVLRLQKTEASVKSYLRGGDML